MKADFFDVDYYQKGIETGKSGYSNYRWLPELTLPMCMVLIDYLHLSREHTILDYGCAYGFYVKGLRMLHRQAWGFDISQHAIDSVDPVVKPYCFKISNPVEIPEFYDFCIAKDVFEHVEYNEIGFILKHIPANNIFIVVPLGKNGKYVAPYNNLDKSHIICESLDWWLEIIDSSGWEFHTFAYRVNGIKDQYYEQYPKAHGFIWCYRNGCRIQSGNPLLLKGE